jgi:hypothetical protein
VLLVKEMLTTVPFVLLIELSSQCVMNVHMVYMMMVLPLHVNPVEIDSHSVTDVIETLVGNVMPTEVLLIVTVLLVMSNQPVENTTLLTQLSVLPVITDVPTVKDNGISVLNLVLMKPEDHSHGVIV